LVFTIDARNRDRVKSSAETHLFNIWTIGATKRTSGQAQGQAEPMTQSRSISLKNWPLGTADILPGIMLNYICSTFSLITLLIASSVLSLIRSPGNEYWRRNPCVWPLCLNWLRPLLPCTSASIDIDILTDRWRGGAVGANSNEGDSRTSLSTQCFVPCQNWQWTYCTSDPRPPLPPNSMKYNFLNKFSTTFKGIIHHINCLIAYYHAEASMATEPLPACCGAPPCYMLLSSGSYRLQILFNQRVSYFHFHFRGRQIFLETPLDCGVYNVHSIKPLPLY